MKHLTKIILALAIAALAGCAAFTKPVVTQQAVQIPARTNIVVVTNTVAGEVVVRTNTIVLPAEIKIVDHTNYIKAELPDEVKAFLATAKTVNTNVNPTPSAPIVNWGLEAVPYAFGAIGGLLALWKNRKANNLADQVDTLKGVATAVIKGVELAPPGIGLDGVKRSVAKVAQAAGVSDDVHAAVQAVAADVKHLVPDEPISTLA